MVFRGCEFDDLLSRVGLSLCQGIHMYTEIDQTTNLQIDSDLSYIDDHRLVMCTTLLRGLLTG